MADDLIVRLQGLRDRLEANLSIVATRGGKHLPLAEEYRRAVYGALPQSFADALNALLQRDVPEVLKELDALIAEAASLPQSLRQGCGCYCCDHGEGSDCACNCHTEGDCSFQTADARSPSGRLPPLTE